MPAEANKNLSVLTNVTKFSSFSLLLKANPAATPIDCISRRLMTPAKRITTDAWTLWLPSSDAP